MHTNSKCRLRWKILEPATVTRVPMTNWIECGTANWSSQWLHHGSVWKGDSVRADSGYNRATIIIVSYLTLVGTPSLYLVMAAAAGSASQRKAPRPILLLHLSVSPKEMRFPELKCFVKEATIELGTDDIYTDTTRGRQQQTRSGHT